MFLKRVGALALLLALSSPFAIGATIVGSPHDLSVAGAGGIGAGDNGETCVYCHTPHAANTGFNGAPLWNKATATTDYMMYGATVQNTAGTTIAGTSTAATPASSSLACLSCHDGISAIDSIVNAPGSGMNTVVGTNNIVTALTTTYGGNIGGTPGTATVGGITDLANDHPVSIPYTAGVASLRATTATLPDAANWISATTVGDLLRDGNVECASCHDPHNGGMIQGTATEVNFLRHTNTASALCVGCHDK